MKQNLYIRADGGKSIGLGHLVRCIALGQMLIKEFNITYICKEAPEQIRKEIEKNLFAFKLIMEEEEFFTLLNKDDIAVLDGYDFTTEYQLKARDRCAKLVCIDDMAKGKFAADLIINHAPGITDADYNAQPYTKFALGPAYALLRKSFLKKASALPEPAVTASVLISFGGSDPLNLTLKTLKIAQTFILLKHIGVLAGASYGHLTSLKAEAKNDSRVVIHHAVSEEKVAQLLSETQLCIVPASGSLFEALAAGCKVISGMYVANQRRIFEGFKSLGAFESAGNFEADELKQAINRCLNKQSHQRKIIDGKSPERLLNLFRAL